MDTSRTTFAPYLPVIRVDTFTCGECGHLSAHQMYAIPGFAKVFCWHCRERLALELQQDGREHTDDRTRFGGEW